MEYCVDLFQEISPPAGIEKEPHMAANATSEIRVQNMLTALRRYKPTFILVILPMDARKDEIYGMESLAPLSCLWLIIQLFTSV